MSHSSPDYHISDQVSDQEARRLYANWRINQDDELRKAEAKFAPESIPEMADRLLEHTKPNDLEYIRKGIRESIVFVYFVILCICFPILMLFGSIIQFSIMNALSYLLVLAILAALITFLGYCRYCQTLRLRAFEYYVWFALQHYRLALNKIDFDKLKQESSLSRTELYDLVPSYIGVLSHLVPKQNLSHWCQHLSHDYAGFAGIIARSSWRKLSKGKHRHLSEADQILRERLLHLADLWYLGLRDYHYLLVAQSEQTKATKQRLEIQTLYKGAILFENFKDADRFGIQLEASREIEEERCKLLVLRSRQVGDYLQPYQEQVAELDTLAERIAALKVKYQTAKALDDLSWRQRDLRHLLDLEDSKFDLELSRLELSQNPPQE